MQNFSQVPIFCDVADWFAYPALSTSTSAPSKTITIAAANSTAKAYITLQPEHYFLFCGFAAQTNYDNAGGVFAVSGTNAIISQPSVPNNFLVEIQRASSNNYSNAQLTQAELGSSGMLSGKQNPYPILYPPSITLSFQFTDLTGLFLLSGSTAVSLQIQFWMLGYSIPESLDGVPDSNFRRFLKYFPALEAEYMNGPRAR